MLEEDVVSQDNTVSFQLGGHKENDSIIKNSVDREEFTKNTSLFLHEDENEDVLNKQETANKEQESDANTEPLTDSKRGRIESDKTTPPPSTCYICIKVNNNKNFVNCPMDRKMKNKLRSEFWFQIYDEW